MTDLPFTLNPGFPDVYQLATDDPVMGGPDGVDNLPHRQLAERTEFLKLGADALDGAIKLLRGRVDGLEFSTGTALRNAVLLNWLYGDASPTFELWGPGFTWRDIAPIAVVSTTAGDDTIELATTTGLIKDATYVLVDAAGNRLETVDISVILNGTRLRTRLNLTRTLTATSGAFLARTSAEVRDGYAIFSPDDALYTRVIEELRSQPGGQLVLRRSATGSGTFAVSYRVAGSSAWALAPLAGTVSRGLDTRDETYTIGVGGRIELRIIFTNSAGASERVDHMVILPPASVDKTPLVGRPINVSPADQAFNVGQTPTLTLSAFRSLYGLPQAGAEFQVARNPTMSDLVVASSADFLASWVGVSGQSTPFTDLVHTASKTFTLVGNGVSLRTTDGGLTFATGTVTGDLRRVHANAGLLAAVGAAGVIRTSTDNGMTYTARTAAASYVGTFGGVFVRGSFIVAVGDGGTIQRSINGGAIFTAVNPDASYAGAFTSLTGDGAGRLIAVGANGEIQTSADDGQTWIHRNAPGGYTGTYQRVRLDAAGRAIAVGTGGAIHTSADFGATWTARTAAVGYTGTFYGVAHRGDLAVAVGANGEIQTSKDAGATWTHRAAAGGTTATFRAASLDADAYGVAVGDGGLVQRTLKLDTAVQTFTVPAGADFLATGVVYWWRGRFIDAEGNFSPWSAPTAFATSATFSYVAAPQNLSPATGDTGVPLLPTLQTSAFATVGGVDTHSRSQFQIATSAAFTSTVYDSGETTDLLVHQVGAGGTLTSQAGYFWRARHKGTTFGFGAWSEPTPFTAQARPNKPSILSPADGALGQSLRPKITTSAFSMAGGGTQSGLQVQIAQVSSFASLTHDSGDAAASTTYTVPAGVLSLSTGYFVRARHKEAGGSYSPWSNIVGFKTMASLDIRSAFSITARRGAGGVQSVTTGVDLTGPDGGGILIAPRAGGAMYSADTARGIGALGALSNIIDLSTADDQQNRPNMVGNLTATGHSVGIDASAANTDYLDYVFKEQSGFFRKLVVAHTTGNTTPIPLPGSTVPGMIMIRPIMGTNGNLVSIWGRNFNAGFNVRFDDQPWGNGANGTQAALVTCDGTSGSAAILPAAPSASYSVWVFEHQPGEAGAIQGVLAQYGPSSDGTTNSVTIPTGWGNGIQFAMLKLLNNYQPWEIYDTVRTPGFTGSADAALRPSRPASGATTFDRIAIEANGDVTLKDGRGGVVFALLIRAPN